MNNSTLKQGPFWILIPLLIAVSVAGFASQHTALHGDSSVILHSPLSRDFFPAQHPVLPPDTVRAGQVYITQLPDSLGSFQVERYTARGLPAMSWLRGNAFFWKTRITDRGSHRFVFHAVLENAEEGSDSNGPDRIVSRDSVVIDLFVE